MRNFKKLSISLSMVLIVVLLSSCATYDNFASAFINKTGSSADIIKIGVFEPQSGKDSDEGKLEIMGIELAQSLTPKVLGKNVELVYEDTQSNIYVAESAIQDLISKKPAVILGAYGEACSLVASDYIKKAKIPAITISATNPLITANNDYYFRTCFLDSSQGAALASYAIERLKAEKIAIIRTTDDDATNAVYKSFTGKVTMLNNNDDAIVDTEEIALDQLDYTDCLKNIIKSKATVVFMPVSINTAEKIFEKATELRMFNVIFIGTKDWHEDEFINVCKKYHGIKAVLASDFSNNIAINAVNATATSFLNAYQTKYGKDAVPASETALGFDAYMLAIKSIEEAGTTNGTAVRDKLALIKNFQGASGEIIFNSTGDPKRTINIDEVRGTNFVSIDAIE